jgi:phospholipid/cholesterol/gamma-HCH transport system permease protein
LTATFLQLSGGMLDRAGELVAAFLVTVGEVSLFAFRAAAALFVPPFEFRETVRQVYELGLRSAPLIAVSGMAVGVVLSMHTRASLERFGAESMIPAGLAIALVRETGPLTAALLLSGRIGAGIGAELGAMRVTEQIDALEASAVDAFRFLVVTRVLACVIALPILTTLMNFSGMLGGFIAEASATGMSLPLYFTRAFSLIGMSDYIPATLKTMVFGFIIATVSSYLGFTTSSGTEGVGRASTQAVVLSSILIIVSNVILVRFIFFVFPAAGG